LYTKNKLVFRPFSNPEGDITWSAETRKSD